MLIQLFVFQLSVLKHLKQFIVMAETKILIKTKQKLFHFVHNNYSCIYIKLLHKPKLTK